MFRVYTSSNALQWRIQDLTLGGVGFGEGGGGVEKIKVLQVIIFSA